MLVAPYLGVGRAAILSIASLACLVAHAQAQETFDDAYPRGALVGEGAFKRVYLVLGEPDRVIAVDKRANGAMGDLGDEEGFLHQLSEAGVPTVEVIASGKTRDGASALVLRRYAAGSRDGEAFDRRVNRRTLSSWRNIRRTLQRERLGVWDLQLLIHRDGHLVVNDPLVVVNQSGRNNDVRYFNTRLRRAYKANTAARRAARAPVQTSRSPGPPTHAARGR